jgi:hypothetical protein
MDFVFTIDNGEYIKLPVGPWLYSPTSAPLENSGDFCAHHNIKGGDRGDMRSILVRVY